MRLIIYLCLFLSTVYSSLGAAKEPFSTDEQQILRWLDQHDKQQLIELQQHVNLNTGTLNKTGIDAYRTLLAEELGALGFDLETISAEPFDVLSCEHKQLQFASHLLATRKGAKGQRLLLSGHMDTVFSAEDSFQTLTIGTDGTLSGPGVADMKGGIVAMLQALRALHALGLLDGTQLTVFLNSDEEFGSLSSRSALETLAPKHDLGLVFESSYEQLMTNERKGLGQARLKITGRESHAGGAHEAGVSANLEIAHKVIAIEALTDYDKGNTVNTGTLKGGEKRNTVPGCAEAYIDLRYPSPEAGPALEQALKNIAAERSTSHPSYPELPKIELWTALHRPVKAKHEKVDHLLDEIDAIATSLGDPIQGRRKSGGGTDGSILQAVGLPSVDSIGVDGSGAHSQREQSSVQSLQARTRLIALLIHRLSQ